MKIWFFLLLLTPLIYGTDKSCSNELCFGVSNKKGYTPLHYAAQNGYTDVINLILENGVNVDPVDKNGNTPLRLAIRYGKPEAVKVLVNNGADININNSKKYNAFCDVVSKTDFTADILKLFIDKGALINEVCDNGNTPIHIAVLNKRSKEIIKVLSEAGANFTVKNNNGETPLHLEINNNYNFDTHMTDKIEYIIKQTSDLDIKDQHGSTPLHLAVHNRLQKVLELLLKHGAKTDIANNDGNTPLHSAIAYHQNNLINTLLDYQANVTIINKQGDLPLHLALYHTNLLITDRLITLMDKFTLV